MSGSYTFSPQSFASTSSNATDTDSSPYRSTFMTSSVIACASRCFCCSDLPGHSFTITCGMALPSSVLLVGDVFEPIDGLAIEVLLHGDVCHRRCWRRAMPVLFARRKPHDVARANLFNGSAPPLDASGPGGHDQRLAERMGVPGGARAWLERHGRTRSSGGSGGLNSGSIRTVPVNQSPGPLADGCEPARVISMAKALSKIGRASG